MDVRLATAFCLWLILLTSVGNGKKAKNGEKPEWAKKDVRDYTDVDVERLLDQWEEDEEPLPDDELPEHLRKAPAIDMSKLSTSDPEQILKLSKKGKTLMMFVTVSGQPSREETEEITKLWHGSLWNSHMQCERFLVDDHRAIFMFQDGSQAWDAKDFLIEQERCKEVSIENKVYEGKYNKTAEKKKSETGKKAKKKNKEEL